MLRIIFSIFMIFSYGISNAQIGINTDQPFSNLTLHIDPQRNTSTSNIQTDDIVVANDGKLGIGTTVPTSNLTINGSLKITDGTQASGYTLTARSDGSSYWGVDTLNQVVSKFALSFNTSIGTLQYDIEYIILGSTIKSSSNSIDGATFDSSTGVISLPAGYYIISYINNLSSTYDFYSAKMYIDGKVFLQNYVYTGSLTFNTIYESSSDFTLYFSSYWNRPSNSNSVRIPSGYSPSISSNIVIEKISLEL